MSVTALPPRPVPDADTQRFWDEAHDKLTRLKPVVVGITGSYGKTSVKHILGHILETADSALSFDPAMPKWTAAG